MDVNRIGNVLVVEAVKGENHFVVRYHNTPAGSRAAKQAVRAWLLDLDLDFNRRDAERVWSAIDACWFSARFDRRAEGGVERGAWSVGR